MIGLLAKLFICLSGRMYPKRCGSRSGKGVFMKFYKRIPLLLVLLLTLGLLQGCQARASGADAEIDYNQYIYSHGFTAYTEDAYIFFENSQLKFLDSALSAPLSILCIRPNCDHTDNSCAAYLASFSVYASDNKLYYMEKDAEGHYGLYELGLDGTDRKLIRSIPLLDASNLGFSYRIYGEYLALEVTYHTGSSDSSAVYLTEFRDAKAEIVPIFGGKDNTDVSYYMTELRDGWLFTCAMTDGDESWTLMGYNIETGEFYTLVEDWDSVGTFSLKDDTLYWYSFRKGFYALSLTDFQQTKFRDCDPNYEFGMGVYDDQYFYFTNSIPGLNDPDVIIPGLGGPDAYIPEEKIGLYIYDYEGNLQQFIPTEGQIYPTFLLATPQYVFFHPIRGELLPQWYIDKEDIPSGTAALIEVE